jgi:hypothetical protein
LPGQIRVTNTMSLRDAFCTELVKLSPPELTTLDLHGSGNLRTFTLSPDGACPRLESLDLSTCPKLTTVLVQSSSITRMSLHGCASLRKVLLQCPNLESLAITGCGELETAMIWSDALSALDMTGCGSLVTLKLACPVLAARTLPPLRQVQEHVAPEHPPIAAMLKDTYGELAQAAAAAAEAEWQTTELLPAFIPRTYRPG